MEKTENKSVHYYMRTLHRDIGFLVVGLSLIYGLSGILMIYRDTGFLKQEKRIERQVATQLPPQELGKILHMRDVQIERADGDTFFFKNGYYNRATGTISYTEQSLPGFLDKLNNLHKASSGNIVHWLTTLYGISLLFLAISSLWMFTPNSRFFKRGMIFTAAGICIAGVLIFLL